VYTSKTLEEAMESIHIKQDRELQMLTSLSDLAQIHADASGGRFVVLPIEPENYTAQRAYHIEGNPQDPGTIETIATAANHEFPALQEQIEEIENENQEITRVGELLGAGNNVVIATNHGDLEDIAIVEAAVYCQLRKLGYQPRTGIIISKMVSMLGFKLSGDVVPATNILKILCRDIFMSFPRTESIHRTGLRRIFGDEVDRHNNKMRELVSQTLDTGGSLLAMAPSGSTDKNLDIKRVRLETIGHGTSNILMHDRTLAIPFAVWLQRSNPFIKLADIPRAHKSELSTHQMMTKIADTLTESVHGKTFSYSALRSLGSTAIDD
jgi:hypothetical protein